jgi:hypothetical protein
MQQIKEAIPNSELTVSATSSSSALAQVQHVPASMLELRAYLDTRDTKQIGTAIIKADVRKVDQVQAQRAELEAQLDKKRKDYKWWVDLFASPEMQAETLANVTAAAELLKKEMALIPVMPTLREVAADYGDKAVKLQIINVITWADGQLNTGQKLTDEQVICIASAVLESYGGLRIEDVATCIKQHVLHATGPVMRLDTQVVMSWFTKYMQERMQRIELDNYNKHLASK